MAVEPDDLWVHSPQFRKVVALAIGALFKTNITMFSPQNTVDIVYSLMFVDAHFNRWGVSLLRSESQPEAFRVCARFPLSDTKIQTFKTILEKEMIDPAFNKSDVHILGQDTTALWHSPQWPIQSSDRCIARSINKSVDGTGCSCYNSCNSGCVYGRF
jgi:hypothetical protein